jgi:hypothetical protein
MSATTEPKADAPRGAGRIEAALDAFDAAETEQVPGAEARPAPGEQAHTPEPPTDGAPTPPRDERGRFTSAQQETQTPQAPATQAEPEPPAEPPADLAAQLAAERARREELERTYSANVEQLRRQAQVYQQQLQQGEQTWRQQYETRIAAERKRQTDALEAQLANSPDLTDREKGLYRAELKAQFLEEDGARKEADWQAERQQLHGVIGRTTHEQRIQQLPVAMQQYVPYMAQLATSLTTVPVTPEEAHAFMAEPWVFEQNRQIMETNYPDEVKRTLLNELGNQQARILGERSRVAAQQRDFAAQQQLATNRTNAAAGGATRELVPGAAGEPAPDYSKYRNSGDIAGALDAYEQDRQAGRAQ